MWSRIRELHPQVPGVIVLAAPSSRATPRVLGHFSALRWQTKNTGGEALHEVAVTAEHLNRSAKDVLETLLHEAAHAHNFARGIHDCSRSQYHNVRFKEVAEELGLEVARVPHYGWALTRLPDRTASRYELAIAALSDVLIHRETRELDAAPDGGDRPHSRYIKASCGCPFLIRVARKTLETTAIRCETCGLRFAPAA
jgi:hypothetical protein